MARASWTLLGVVAFAALLWQVAAVFATPDNPSAPTFGSAGAPYSDALGPWLDGGLAFLFDQAIPTYLYRPSIGLFWSSIIGSLGRVDMIPVFFVAWLFIVLLGTLILARDQALRNALIIWLTLSAVCFAQTWLPLNIATAAIDFPAFVLTLSGAILLFFAPDRRSLRLWELAAACLCLGIAAAVRGPMMFGGIIMILLRVAMIAERRWLAGLTAATLFLLPILVELSLQRAFGVINNGVMALFCVYSDPTHTWSPACNEAFLAAAPAKIEVLGGYLRFMFSAAGVDLFGDRFLQRIAQDVAVLQQGTVYALVLIAGVVVALTSDDGAGAAEDAAPRPGVRRGVRRLWQFLRGVLPALLIVGSLLLVQRVAAAWSPTAAAWVLLALAAVAAAGYWRAMLCLGGYLGGTLFLVLSGLSGLERLQATFSFLLYLGVALAVAETVRPSDLRTASVGRWPVPITWVVLSALAFLYGGDYLSSGTSSLRRTYLEDVQGHPTTAMKLSDDARIDRSLYYTGDRRLVYTRYDGLPIGTVRKYRRLAEESNVANSSFLSPNTFLE